MGTDYRCNSCGLTFTDGWDHYHHFTDYAAETKLVCTECGTCHVVEHAIGGKVADAMLAQPGPLFTPTPPLVVTFEGWRRCEVTVNLRPVRQKPESVTLEGLTDPLNLADVECAHCHARGTLTDNWPEGETRCPHCKQHGLETLGCWMR